MTPTSGFTPLASIVVEETHVEEVDRGVGTGFGGIEIVHTKRDDRLRRRSEIAERNRHRILGSPLWTKNVYPIRVLPTLNKLATFNDLCPSKIRYTLLTRCLR